LKREKKKNLLFCHPTRNNRGDRGRNVLELVPEPTY